MSRTAVLLPFLLSCTTPPTAPEPSWYRVNFHSHMKSPFYGDDGLRPPLEEYREYQERGYDLNVHSVHARREKPGEGDGDWHRLREFEAALPLRIGRSLGVEVEVAPGPGYRETERNLNHLTGAGVSNPVPSGLPLRESLDRIHALGGIAIVNHPGPPHHLHWERGYWEAPGHRERIDGIEVYNGRSMQFWVNFERRYREAAGGLGLYLAAVSGSDTHAKKGERRLEVTYVLAASASIDDVIAAVRERRTIAAYGFFDLRPDCPQLGKIIPARGARLVMDLGREMERIDLYANARKVGSWTRTARVEFVAEVGERTAFVWHFRDGVHRGTTSATWLVPDARPLPDLTIARGSGLRVRNVGDAPSGPYRLRIGDEVREMPSLPPGGEVALDPDVDAVTLIDVEGGAERDHRNNSFLYRP